MSHQWFRQLQNNEKWGPQVERFLAPHASQVIGVAEHHLVEASLALVVPRLERFNAFATLASPSGRSSEGTQAGTMVLANKAIFVAQLPAENRHAAAPAAKFMRWSACEVRFRGSSVLFLAAYFFAGQAINSPDNSVVIMQFAVVCGLWPLTGKIRNSRLARQAS